MNLSPEDQDWIIRTVIGEAANQGDVGQRAVAHVILNRARGAGQGVRDVVLAQGQFEPWGTPATAQRLMSYAPTSPTYQRVSQILAPVFAGRDQDPTGGATHFYAPAAQASLGRRPPSWDNGAGFDIGDHRFFRLGYSGSSAGNRHGIPTGGAAAARPSGGSLWDQAGAILGDMAVQWDEDPAPQATGTTTAAPASPATPLAAPALQQAEKPVQAAIEVTWDDAPSVPASPSSASVVAREVPEITVGGRRPEAQAPAGIDARPDIGAAFADARGAQGGANATERQRLGAGIRSAADERLLAGMSPAEREQLAFTGNALNTALLNAPRNFKAFVRSFGSGRSFNDEYSYQRDREEAAARQNPGNALAGTAAGIGGAVAALPVAGAGQGAARATGFAAPVVNFLTRQAPTVGGRMGQAALTGAGYAGVAEAADSKNALNAFGAAAIGAGVGALGQRAGETVANRLFAPRALDAAGAVSQNLFSRARAAGMSSDEVTNMVTGLRRAGLDDAQIGSRLLSEVERRASGQGPSAAIANEVAAGQMGVRLTRGQAAQDLAAQQVEQTAARSAAANPRAHDTARGFFEAQDEAVRAARGDIGQRIGGQAESPLDAAAAVTQGVRDSAAAAKARASGLYEEAFSRPGEFARGAIEGIGPRIQQQLSSRADPVIVDTVTTPAAARMIDDLANVSGLRIPNLADPGGAPAASEIVGVNMRGVDQARRRLVSLARGAQPGSADARAARSVIAGFDDEIERAMSAGLFSGDDRALDALRGARAAYASYQRTFKPQGAGDDVGQAMRRIVERDAQPQEVANLLYGSARVGERGVSVRLADRLKQVLGENSPEWSEIRQGLWQRLTQRPEGVTDFGPQAQSQRIANFLNGDGRELARRLFSPAELRTMREYANVLHLVTPMRGSVNSSGTAYMQPMVQRIQEKYLPTIGQMLGTAAGATTGGAVGGMIGGASAREAAGRVAAGREARRVSEMILNAYPQYRPNVVPPGRVGAATGVVADDFYGQ